jgi:hypothetical protein
MIERDEPSRRRLLPVGSFLCPFAGFEERRSVRLSAAEASKV